MKIINLLLLTLTMGCTAENLDTSQEGKRDDSPEEQSDDDDSDTDEGQDSTETDSDENDTLEWKLANLTWYESYPEEGSEECIEYNGCQWAGWFAGLPDQMSPEWVASHNIASVHEDHFPEYNGKTLRVRKGEDHLIDVQSHTLQRYRFPTAQLPLERGS